MNTSRIFSVIESYIGHRTYGQLMQDYFSQSEGCKVDFYWHDEDRELRSKVIRYLLSYQPSNPWIRKQNADLFLFRCQLAMAYLTRRILLRHLGKAHYSALHLHTQPLAYLCLDLMKQYPTIVSLDRTAAQASREYTKPSMRWTFAPNLDRDKKVFEAAKSIVSFSEAARRSVIEDYDISPKKVVVVYPGVDVDKILLAESQNNSSEKRFNILFVGGDFERKGGHDLVNVFLENFADRAELHLVTQAPIDVNHPHIHIYKNIKAYTPDWLALYHQADVFVMPTYAEPFGWVFIEAMAAGLSIVATNITAIPEMVTSGENGFLIEPGDRPALAQSIQTLIDNDQLRQQMGKQGRYLVEQKFNAKTHFEKLERLLQEAAIA